MGRSYKLGRIAGIPIGVHFSFLLLLGLILVWRGGVAGVLVALVAFASVVLHELGHALTARRLGVRIAGIDLHFFGGAAKMLDTPRSARDEIAIAAAGPAVSLVLAGIGLGLAALTGVGALALFGWVNLVIGVFNLLPALPMDGGRILRALLSFRLGFQRATLQSIKVARVLAIGLGLFGLAAGHFQLALLAVFVWLMGSAEKRMAELGLSGYRGEAPVPAPGGLDGEIIDGPPPGDPFGAPRTVRRPDGVIIVFGPRIFIPRA
jgi:Zn-dependent protease